MSWLNLCKALKHNGNWEWSRDLNSLSCTSPCMLCKVRDGVLTLGLLICDVPCCSEDEEQIMPPPGESRPEERDGQPPAEPEWEWGRQDLYAFSQPQQPIPGWFPCPTSFQRQHLASVQGGLSMASQSFSRAQPRSVRMNVQMARPKACRKPSRTSNPQRPVLQPRRQTPFHAAYACTSVQSSPLSSHMQAASSTQARNTRKLLSGGEARHCMVSASSHRAGRSRRRACKASLSSAEFMASAAVRSVITGIAAVAGI